MGGSAPAGAGGSSLFIRQLTFERQANMDKIMQRMFPNVITSLPDRGPRPGGPTGFGTATKPAAPATPEKEATKASGEQLDRRRRRRPSASGRLTAPKALQRRTLLGE